MKFKATRTAATLDFKVQSEVCGDLDDTSREIRVACHVFFESGPNPEQYTHGTINPAVLYTAWTGTKEDLGPLSEAALNPFPATAIVAYVKTVWVDAKLTGNVGEDGTMLDGTISGTARFSIPNVDRLRAGAIGTDAYYVPAGVGPVSMLNFMRNTPDTQNPLSNVWVVAIASNYTNTARKTMIQLTVSCEGKGSSSGIEREDLTF
jgi:hypothetical protein